MLQVGSSEVSGKGDDLPCSPRCLAHAGFGRSWLYEVVECLSCKARSAPLGMADLVHRLYVAELLDTCRDTGRSVGRSGPRGKELG